MLCRSLLLLTEKLFKKESDLHCKHLSPSRTRRCNCCAENNWSFFNPTTQRNEIKSDLNLTIRLCANDVFGNFLLFIELHCSLPCSFRTLNNCSHGNATGLIFSNVAQQLDLLYLPLFRIEACHEPSR